MDMTEEQIMRIVVSVDKFVYGIMDENSIDIIDVSALIHSRLRSLSVESELAEDYDALVDHLNSQTIIMSKMVH